jgi:hypothetical protein
MNLAEITEEIAALEKRLELLHTAETALKALEGSTNPARVLVDIADWKEDKPRATGISAAIRGLISEKGPMTKADIDKALSNRSDPTSLYRGKGSVSGALQAMKVRGVVARTKAGKWIVK